MLYLSANFVFVNISEMMSHWSRLDDVALVRYHVLLFCLPGPSLGTVLKCRAVLSFANIYINVSWRRLLFVFVNFEVISRWSGLDDATLARYHGLLFCLSGLWLGSFWNGRLFFFVFFKVNI